MDNRKVYEIDNEVREKMTHFDPQRHNFFEKDFSLMMDFTPYRDKIVPGKPMRTPEHRLIYVESGYATLQISFDDYEIRKGSLLLVPRGSVIITEEVSNSYNPWTISFNVPEADGQMLVPYTVTKLQLPESEETTVANYFQLINQLIKKDNVNRRSIDFLIVSLLYRIYTLREEAAQISGTGRSTRGMIIRDNFLYLINQPGIPEREVGWYAKQLNITAEYLRSTIKAQTMQTPMQWINMATLREARLLLVDEMHYSLDQIAERLHCGNASQFIKFFKKETGETPNDFRKRMQPQS